MYRQNGKLYARIPGVGIRVLTFHKARVPRGWSLWHTYKHKGEDRLYIP